jgi:dienelactone hydrolase/HEAT repeat protein
MTPEQEEARLEQAMQRGDELLVNSLKNEDRRRWRTRATIAASIVVVAGIAAFVIAHRPASPPRPTEDNVVAVARTTQASPPASSAPSADTLASLSDDNWRRAFAIGNQLAQMPPEKSWAILQANWSKIPNYEARQQILKAFIFPNPSGKPHPRVLDVLHLGMTDPEPQVRAWAATYLHGIAFQDFAEDSTAYAAWRERSAGRDVTEVAAEGAAAWVLRLKAAKGDEIKVHARSVRAVRNDLARIPAARDAAIKAGALDVATTWLRQHADDRDGDVVVGARDLLTALRPDEAYLKSVILPMLDANNPAEMRRAAIQVLGRADNRWAVDPLLAVLRETVTSTDKGRRSMIWDVAQALAEIGDPRAIPDMIAAIAHDDTYDTVYGVGYFGLSKITGVRYDETHNGQWWRQWWERERMRFPEPARSSPIPVLDKTKSARSDAASVRPIFAMMLAAALDAGDMPVQDLRANNDEKMRFFLMGPKTKTAPADGYRLLLVLPGGDGGEDFRPFIESVAQDSVSNQYLVAQLVAPKWSGSENLVWPKEKDAAQGAPIATEKFIDAVVADIAKLHKLDAKHIYALGWSSSGPPVYATAMRAKTPLTGAFVAMSVFKSEECPPASNARGRAFYILHSPQDFIQMRFPQAAQKALSSAGAKVKLTTYPGGHGWHGDPPKMIRTGVTWLESQSKSPTTRASTTPSTRGLGVSPERSN